MEFLNPKMNFRNINWEELIGIWMNIDQCYITTLFSEDCLQGVVRSVISKGNPGPSFYGFCIRDTLGDLCLKQGCWDICPTCTRRPMPFYMLLNTGKERKEFSKYLKQILW